MLILRVNTKDFSIVCKALHNLAIGPLLDLVSAHTSLISLCISTASLFLFFKICKVNSAWNARYPGIFQLLQFFEDFCPNVIFSVGLLLYKMSTDPTCLAYYYVYQNKYANYINYVLIK